MRVSFRNRGCYSGGSLRRGLSGTTNYATRNRNISKQTKLRHEVKQQSIRTTSTNEKKGWAKRLQGFSLDSVWTEFTPLSIKHKAVNLGQGFPDFPGASFILEAAGNAIKDNLNQYTRSQGHLRLVNAIAAYYNPIFKREINPLSEVVITMGATEGIFASILAVVNPGDEVILIEPFYDSYPCDVTIAGGIPKYIPLRPQGKSNSSADWVLDFKELEAAITPKTKMIVVNTPQNIPGKVYSMQELEGIASLAKKHDLYVLSDEVYEAMVYDGEKQNRIATLPGMFERTITLGSAGKSFSVTGWKTGWVIAPKNLADAIWVVHQNTTFASNTPMQEAVGVGFEKVLKEESAYFPELKAMYQKKRDKMCNILKGVGLEPLVPQGSYFVLANTSKINPKHYFNPNDSASKDFQFCRWLTKEIGVSAIPPTAFYSQKDAHLAVDLARFCFCKKEETLDEAANRLTKLKQYL